MKEIIIKDVSILLYEDCPDDSAVVRKLKTLNYMNLHFINRWQKQERNFPDSQAGCEGYCLYLGSMIEKREANGKVIENKVDLWHYPYYCNDFNNYSTGIICGNEPGDYRSGWPQLAYRHDSYRELLRREVLAGLVDDPSIIVQLGLAVLDLRPDMSEVMYNDRINSSGGGYNSFNDFEDGYVNLDWWDGIWSFEKLGESYG
jgi:hypothetical protein